MKIVKVTWIDSVISNMNWMLLSDIKEWENIEPLTIYTYGALVQEDENYIVVAANYGKDPEQCAALTSIPKGCIKDIKELEEL